MRKLKMKGTSDTWTALYKFDSGEYFTLDSGIYCSTSCVAVMNDGSLKALCHGRHFDIKGEYEIYEV